MVPKNLVGIVAVFLTYSVIGTTPVVASEGQAARFPNNDRLDESVALPAVDHVVASSTIPQDPAASQVRRTSSSTSHSYPTTTELMREHAFDQSLQSNQPQDSTDKDKDDSTMVAFLLFGIVYAMLVTAIVIIVRAVLRRTAYSRPKKPSRGAEKHEKALSTTSSEEGTQFRSSTQESEQDALFLEEIMSGPPPDDTQDDSLASYVLPKLDLLGRPDSCSPTNRSIHVFLDDNSSGASGTDRSWRNKNRKVGSWFQGMSDKKNKTTTRNKDRHPPLETIESVVPHHSKNLEPDGLSFGLDGKLEDGCYDPASAAVSRRIAALPRGQQNQDSISYLDESTSAAIVRGMAALPRTHHVRSSSIHSTSTMSSSVASEGLMEPKQTTATPPPTTMTTTTTTVLPYDPTSSSAAMTHRIMTSLAQSAHRRSDSIQSNRTDCSETTQSEGPIESLTSPVDPKELLAYQSSTGDATLNSDDRAVTTTTSTDGASENAANTESSTPQALEWSQTHEEKVGIDEGSSTSNSTAITGPGLPEAEPETSTAATENSNNNDDHRKFLTKMMDLHERWSVLPDEEHGYKEDSMDEEEEDMRGGYLPMKPPTQAKQAPTRRSFQRHKHHRHNHSEDSHQRHDDQHADIVPVPSISAKSFEDDMVSSIAESIVSMESWRFETTSTTAQSHSPHTDEVVMDDNNAMSSSQTV